MPKFVILLGSFFTAFLAVSLTLMTAAPVSAEIYQFVDRNGIIHLSNVPTDPRYKPLKLDNASRRFPLPATLLNPMISRNARRHGIHPALLRAVIKAESNFIPTAVSRAGAQGLMQLMPNTALSLNVRDPFDPEQNVNGGSKHLRELLDRYKGNLTLALAAYNAGAAAVDRYNALPPIRETRHYVRKVLGFYHTYLAQGWRPISPPSPSKTVAPLK